jgi:hypothetical protein
LGLVIFGWTNLFKGLSKRLNFLERSLKNSFSIPIGVIFCLILGTASAQTTVSYTSPVADYQPFVDEKITSWKAANDKVGQIGGWRAYAKEAQQPDNTPTPTTAPAPVQNKAPMQKPASNNSDAMKTDPHAGHKP